MSRIRLLPIVIVAASGLLVLKATALITSGESLFAENQPAKKIMTEDDLPKFARVLARMRFIPPPPDPEVTGSVPAKKDAAKKEEADKKAEAGKNGQKVAEQKPSSPAASNPSIPSQPIPAQPLPAPQPVQNTSATERAILERLQERRGVIDERVREIDLRENLLKAAEKKLDGRIGELKEIEGKIDGSAKAEQVEAEKQIKAVVIMYEAMKPKDAARVFDRLKLDVLVPIVTAMKPARMAEVLAAMSPESAEKLTVALASKGRPGSGGAPASSRSGDVPGELPRIDKQRQ
ncbi:MAG: MotE family protein [Beijerinckiaceae bacterium]